MHGGSFCVQRDCNRDESTAVLHETCGTAALFVGCAKKSPKRLLTKTLVKLIGGGGGKNKSVRLPGFGPGGPCGVYTEI